MNLGGGDTPAPSVPFVIAALDPGGSESQLVELVRRVHPDRVRASVAVFRRARDPRLTKQLDAAGVDVQVLFGVGMPRAFQDAFAGTRITDLVQAVRPDLVYAWLEEAALAAVPAARRPGARAIVARRNVCGWQMERIALLEDRHPSQRPSARDGQLPPPSPSKLLVAA
jgi:hypothetical protein